MFSSCSSLETIYATSSSNTGLSGSLMFNGCYKLVGGTDGFVPSSTSGASVCKIGTSGVLTDLNADARTWFWAHVYDNGEAVLTANSLPDPTRTTGPTHRQHLTSVTFAADMATFSFLNLIYLFYTCTNLTSVSGLETCTACAPCATRSARARSRRLTSVASTRRILRTCSIRFWGARTSRPSTQARRGRCQRVGSRGRSASTRAPRRSWVGMALCGPAARRGTHTSALTLRARLDTSPRRNIQFGILECPPPAVKLLCSTKLSSRGGYGRFVCSSSTNLPNMRVH